MRAPAVVVAAGLSLLAAKAAAPAKKAPAKKPAVAKATAAWDFQKHLGAVRLHGDLVCFDVPALAQPVGTRVTVISLSDPQEIAEATVGGLCPLSTLNAALVNRSPVSAQEIRWENDAPAHFTSGIGILGGAKVAMRDDLATADLDGDGKPETFADCPGSDGAHLTVWTGAPRTGTRRWHTYLVSGEDTEPGCTDAESKP